MRDAQPSTGMRDAPTLTARSARLSLRMSPPWPFIDDVRRFVENFGACASGGPERDAQVAMAVHELMQNALAHAAGADVELEVEIDPDRDRIEIRVTNPCSDEAYALLGARVERMNREPDALAWYLRCMGEESGRARGGLGLARLRFEGQLEISLSRRDAGRVAVCAAGKVRTPPLEVGGNHA